MSDFSTLKTKIAAICTANTKIGEVVTYDKPTFDAFPVAMVVPSGNESDYATVVDNKRTYSFIITLLVPYDPKGAAAAESTLVDLVDSLIDDFDEDYTLTGSCLMMQAAPSAWGYQEREIVYRVATINLRCMTYFNVT